MPPFLQSDIGYTGISFCWPDPQGPEQGYNAMNAIVNNDVSRFMNYFETGDGGGIHIIGAVHNASHVSGNWFHGRCPWDSRSFPGYERLREGRGRRSFYLPCSSLEF